MSLQILENYTYQKPTIGGIYTEGIVGQPAIINPVLSSNDIDKSISRLIFNDLTELSTLIKNEDSRVWTVRLKDNLFWHDGEPITSDDVIFTIQTAQNPSVYSPLFTTWQGVIAERISEKEIRLTIRTPYVFFLDNLKDLLIIPKHLFATIPATNLRLSDYILEAKGSGPYKFGSYQKRRDGFIVKYSLKANENYFGNHPYIDQIEFSFYNKPEELVKAFNNGEIDGFGTFDPKLLKQITRNSNTRSITLPQYYAVFLNQNSSLPLKDKNIRVALDLALDRSRIAKEVVEDEAILTSGPLVPGSAGYNAEVNSPSVWNPVKARDILDSSGWKLDEGNIRFKNIGKNIIKLDFNMIVPDSPTLVNAAQIIRENLETIGVRVNLDIMNIDSINRDIIPSRNYQMILFGNITGRQPDFFSFWHSSQRFYPGLNLALYQNKTADNLIESIRQNTNETKRQKDLISLQSVIIQDQPVLFLYSPKYVYIHESQLRGFEENWLLTPADRFDNIDLWYVKTSQALRSTR